MYEKITRYFLQRVRLTEDELQHILQHFVFQACKKNDILSFKGELPRKMFFVNQGCLRVYFTKDDGSEVTRRFAFENFFSTSLVSFIANEPLEEYTQAVEKTDLLYITRSDFYALVDSISALKDFYVKYLEFAYISNTNRLQSFITLDAAGRYKLLLQENPEMVLRLPSKLVANYLNISQEAFSRLKSKI